MPQNHPKFTQIIDFNQLSWVEAEFHESGGVEKNCWVNAASAALE